MGEESWENEIDKPVPPVWPSGLDPRRGLLFVLRGIVGMVSGRRCGNRETETFDVRMEEKLCLGAHFAALHMRIHGRLFLRSIQSFSSYRVRQDTLPDYEPLSIEVLFALEDAQRSAIPEKTSSTNEKKTGLFFFYGNHDFR